MEWHKIHPLRVHLKSSQLTHTAWDGQALGWGWGSGWDLSNTSSPPPPPPPQPWTICTHLFLTSLLGAVLKFLLGIFILFLCGIPQKNHFKKETIPYWCQCWEGTTAPSSPPFPHTHTHTHTFLERNSWLEQQAFIIVESLRQGFF